MLGTLKRNVIANYAGQLWVALMGFVFVPQYILYLGVESYGLIGVFAVLTAWLSVIDASVSPTLAREMAQYVGGRQSAESIRDVLRSAEIITLCVATVACLVIYALSDWLSTSWVRTESLPSTTVSQAIAVMGIVVALRFWEGVYRSSLQGLQRQVLLNAVNCIMATLRGAGAVGVLAWHSPTIKAYFVWQLAVSVCTLIVLALATYPSLGRSSRQGRFSLDVLRGMWRFAGGVFCISLLAMLLTQVDKLLLSRMLSLADFGYYTIAGLWAGLVGMLTVPIMQAFFPKLSELHGSRNDGGFVTTFHLGAQCVAVVVGTTTLVLAVFPAEVLRLWSGNEALISNVAPILRLLAAGAMLNALMGMPFQAQLASGVTQLSVRINIAAVVVIVPMLLWVVPRYGAQGAAWTWVALNVGYFLLGAQVMYRQVLPLEKKTWYLHDTLLPICAAATVVVTAKSFVPDEPAAWSLWLVIVLALVGGGIAGAVAAPLVRTQLRGAVMQVLRNRA